MSEDGAKVGKKGTDGGGPKTGALSWDGGGQGSRNLQMSLDLSGRGPCEVV